MTHTTSAALLDTTHGTSALHRVRWTTGDDASAPILRRAAQGALLSETRVQLGFDDLTGRVRAAYGRLSDGPERAAGERPVQLKDWRRCASRPLPDHDARSAKKPNATSSHPRPLTPPNGA